MTDATHALISEDRDQRLDQALNLLQVSHARRRNGAMPVVAVTVMALSGALLASQFSTREAKTPSRPAVPIVAQAPKADFELSASSAAAPMAGAAPAGSERPR
ncbi:MAG: hypothetical protein JF615_09865 [Asticcacaulis sp.]|nr:hypothetical protein [Asticcacaulis sp.]